MYLLSSERNIHKDLGLSSLTFPGLIMIFRAGTNQVSIVMHLLETGSTRFVDLIGVLASAVRISAFFTIYCKL